MIDLGPLKAIYNATIDNMLSGLGLGTECKLIYKDTKQTQCYNCLYDPISKKSANKYKELNTINFQSGGDWNSQDGNLLSVGTSGKASAYGTFDQSGNAWERLSATVFDIYNVVRAGAWNSTSVTQASSMVRGFVDMSSVSNIVSFRIASISNPDNYSQFVAVNNPNNLADNTGYGSVAYSYKIAKYETTNSEYVEFLNSVAKTDTQNLYDVNMTSDVRGGILRSGSSGNYVYSTKENMADKPVVYTTWFSTLRFCNWLHNGRTSTSSTESGAYALNNTNDPAVQKTAGAKYYMPTENEWYKAAFYSPSILSYWDYATQTNSVPGTTASDSIGRGKSLGPIAFGREISASQLCPVCLGAGQIKVTASENASFIVIFDYKNFMGSRNAIHLVEGYAQTVCSAAYYTKIKRCGELIIDTTKISSSQNVFVRQSEPAPVGLGDNDYIFTNWKRKE